MTAYSAAATSKMESSVTKHSILDVAAALDPPLILKSPIKLAKNVSLEGF